MLEPSMTSAMESSIADSMILFCKTVLTIRNDSMIGTPELSSVPRVRANLATETFR